MKLGTYLTGIKARARVAAMFIFGIAIGADFVTSRPVGAGAIRTLADVTAVVIFGQSVIAVLEAHDGPAACVGCACADLTAIGVRLRHQRAVQVTGGTGVDVVTI